MKIIQKFSFKVMKIPYKTKVMAFQNKYTDNLYCNGKPNLKL